MRNNTSWLQHIPKHWEIMRLKDVCELNPNPTDENIIGTVSFVPMESLRYDCITPMSIDYNEARGKYTYFCNEDLLIAKVTPCFENGNVAIAKDLMQGVGFGTSEIFVLRNNEKIKNRFLFYVVRTNAFIGQACSTMYGVGGLKRISPLFMRTASIPLPPLSEQEKIARYLDTKVGEIDQKVSLIEKKIEHYQLLKRSIINKVVTKGLHPEAPLKDSQISWLGQIPAHWEEKRLKDLGYFYGGLSGKSGEDFQNEDEDVIKPFIPYTNILNNFYVNPEVVKYVVINDNESQNTIQKGDLLFLMSSEDYESIAKASVVNEEVDELYLNSFCKGMKITNKQIYSPFLCYLLSNNDCRDSLRFEAQGFTRINIKTGKVACASIIIPPLSEQQQIASYLDQKCAEIDTIIFNCTAQIEKYKTLKRALINEVVTGQRTIE